MRSADMDAEVQIDDSLYSRQRYMLGDNAMRQLAQSNVLLFGIGGLGVEIAKNLVLAGIKSLTIQDAKVSSCSDLGTQFFLRQDDVTSGKLRVEASTPRLAELNPYVTVHCNTTPLTEDTDLEYLRQFQCVILTETTLGLQRKLNAFCRVQTPPIKFISADVYGVFCWTFCDFGDDFVVDDPDGEEPKETFISNITKGNLGVVTSLEEKMHGFEDGDFVTFKEVGGMTTLNGKRYKIQVMSPYAFAICDTSAADFEPYTNGGVATQCKVRKTATFECLERQLRSPAILAADLAKLDAPVNIHLGMLALNKFIQLHSRLPNTWCSKDAAEFVQIAMEENRVMSNPVETIDEELLRNLSFTCQGCLAPLCATLGGIAAQEALKALTGKFTPLNQWFYLDACEILSGLDSTKTDSFKPQQNRYDILRICIGEDMIRKLSELRLFMIGCGAIGCEMLKNYAVLGVATSEKGQITITDNDLIEKSNLNRQFLFRPHHIQQPKSTTAARSAVDINPDLHIDAHQHKVCPQSENSVYTDSFFESQDVIVNALDNLEARRYVDNRCVTNQRALLESGTMGAKGHVQVVVPHMTESYNSQRDPPDEDVPYCTLKSFPAVIEHCIQWARDKFESSYSQKPSLYNKFWNSFGSPQEVIQKLENGIMLEGAVVVTLMASRRPQTWKQCVTVARAKFEKYFNHKAKYLLQAFPLDTRLKDGSYFWQSPKRPPSCIEFDSRCELMTCNAMQSLERVCDNPPKDHPAETLQPHMSQFGIERHLQFVRSCARLHAGVNQVHFTEQDLTDKSLCKILEDVPVPQFRPSAKRIETEESAKKPEILVESGDDMKDSATRLKTLLEHGHSDGVFQQMSAQMFEKDDDSNGHIDYITASSNLRAAMYNIESADRFKTKRIAGRIVPAIATTTAAVAGLVTIELIKLLKKASLSDYKNCFLNLALPSVLFSEPGAVEKTTMRNGTSFSLWDRWDIHGKKDYTLRQFLDHCKEKYHVEPAMVVQGVKMIYVPIIPGHKKRMSQLMLKLIRPVTSKTYVDLILSYAGEEEEVGPPVRYYFDTP